MQQQQSTKPVEDAPALLTQDEIRAAIAQSLGVAPADINADDNLVVLGLGSLEMMHLINRWKRRGVRAEFRELAANPTLRGWSEYLSSPSQPT